MNTLNNRKKKPFNLIYEAEWNDVPCADYPLTPEEWVAECLQRLTNTQVDTLFYNLCSSDGYVCELENGQILMYQTKGEKGIGQELDKFRR